MEYLSSSAMQRGTSIHSRSNDATTSLANLAAREPAAECLMADGRSERGGNGPPRRMRWMEKMPLCKQGPPIIISMVRQFGKGAGRPEFGERVDLCLQRHPLFRFLRDRVRSRGWLESYENV